MSGRSRTVLAAGLIIVILAAGVAIGVVIGRRGAAPAEQSELGPRPSRGFAKGRMLERFKRRLALNADQATKVAAILENARAESDSIHERVGPELQAIRTRTRKEIRALLLPEQAKSYDRLIAEREQRRQRRRDREHREPRGERKGPKRSAEHAWSAVDANDDGEISRAECDSSEHPLGRMCTRRWDSFDTDGSGSIDKAEMAAARAAMHKKMREGWE